MALCGLKSSSLPGFEQRLLGWGGGLADMSGLGLLSLRETKLYHAAEN